MLADTPRLRSSSPTRSASSRSLAWSLCRIGGALINAMSAWSNASPYGSSKIFRRLELERGSKMATRRRSGQRSAIARTVSRTAVGWCAKSSTTSTPSASASTSCRRFIPAKEANPSAICAGVTPSSSAMAHTPRALSRLCRPLMGKKISVCSCPYARSVKRCPPGAARAFRATISSSSSPTVATRARVCSASASTWGSPPCSASSPSGSTRAANSRKASRYSSQES